MSVGAAPVFVDGQAQIVPAFADSTQWIREELWVEAEFDSDGDGKRDRMHVDVTRQRQTNTESLKVPVVYESSPYFAGTSGPRRFLWNVNQEVGAEPPARESQPEIPFRAQRPRISNSEVNTWVPRGFAVVHSEAPGTGLSQGCPTVGDAPEQLAPKAVIDWLNGRAKGFTTRDGDTPVRATWTTGKVGMTGTSYNGTIPLAAAVTGVAGLEAIIPIAPNTSYYHYYRSNGLVRHPGGWLGEDIDFLYDFVHSGDPARRAYCNRTVRDGLFAAKRDRTHGDYNEFWASRDLLTKVQGIKAATLLAHGLNDWNVVPEHSIRIYEALKARRVPAQLYLHQGGHGGPPPLEMRNRWFSHFLYGIANGVEDEPRLAVMREGAARVTRYGDYPETTAESVTMHPGLGGNRIGTLLPSASTTTGEARERLIDDVRVSGSANASLPSAPGRLLYATPALRQSLRLSGTPRVTLRLASSTAAANLSVWLVMLPFDSTVTGSDGRAGVVTRGWADPQNHRALQRGGNFASMQPGTPLVPGTFYTLTFDLQPDDQVIPAGKQLALMLMSSDREFTLWPKPGTALTFDLAGSSLSLPVVGGLQSLLRAIAGP
jgi:X-Pro dipeptidyl-peptidase